MPGRPITFAVPGDLRTRTGGYLYDAEVIAALSAMGREVVHLALPDGFPDACHATRRAAVARLAGVPDAHALVVDGLALGALGRDGLEVLRAPLVAMVHHPLALESGLDPARREALAASEAAALAHARAVIVPSPHTARTLTEGFRVPAARLHVAEPGHAKTPCARRPATPPLILSVGSLVPRKGHDVLIDALAAVADLPWQAVIAGGMSDPACAQDLRAQCAARKLSGRVTFAGSVSDATLADLFARAHVFALATRYEGYGMVFAEALANGVPIVSCRAGAVPDTVPGAAGRLVPPDDAFAFAAALRRVLTDPAEHARLAGAAAAAGAALPGWADTAAVFARVADAL